MRSMRRKAKQKTQNVKADAFFTIEACVIVPVTFVLITAVFLLAFSIHDEIRVKALCKETVINAVDDVKAGRMAEPEETLQVTQNLLYMKHAGMKLSIQKDSLEAYGEGTFQFSSGMIRQMLSFVSAFEHASYRLIKADARKEILEYKALADGVELVIPKEGG